MDQETAQRLRAMIDTVPTAALATVHKGEPAVSMVPWVWSPQLQALLIHVSALATHSRDMRQHARVALLVCAAAQAEVSPQALPRVAFQAQAQFLDKDNQALYAAQTQVYLQRFADAQIMFELGDFSLVALHPLSARLVAGFGQAHSLVGQALHDWLQKPPQ